MSSLRITILTAVVGAAWSSVALAQPIGTFRWQLQPHCNVVTLSVVQEGAIFTLDGTDDRCGDSQVGSVVGIAFFNPIGTVGFGFTTVLPNGTPVHTGATLVLATLNGTWQDSVGNSGTFVFTPGASTGGAVRPVPAAGILPGSITMVEIAAGAVGICS